MNYVSTLARYKAWADELLLAAAGELPAAALTAPRAIVFGSLLRTLHHAYAMDHVWRCHLLGQPHGLVSRNPPHCPELGELAMAQRQIDHWYVEYVDGLSDAAMQQRVNFEFIGGQRGCMTRSEIVLHVVNHTTYHRGHVADMFYAQHVAPPTTDLPVFLRDVAGDP